MKKILILIPFVFSLGCTIKSITPTDGLEVSMDFDLSSLDMRHGWTFLTIPKKTTEFRTDNDSIQRGEKLYVQHCQMCHGLKGRGDGPMAEKMKVKPKDLTNLPISVSDTYLVVQINNGKGEMPQWQDFLNTQQTWDLTHYLRSISSPKK